MNRLAGKVLLVDLLRERMGPAHFDKMAARYIPKDELVLLAKVAGAPTDTPTDLVNQAIKKMSPEQYEQYRGDVAGAMRKGLHTTKSVAYGTVLPTVSPVVSGAAGERLLSYSLGDTTPPEPVEDITHWWQGPGALDAKHTAIASLPYAGATALGGLLNSEGSRSKTLGGAAGGGLGYAAMKALGDYAGKPGSGIADWLSKNIPGITPEVFSQLLGGLGMLGGAWGGGALADNMFGEPKEHHRKGEDYV